MQTAVEPQRKRLALAFDSYDEAEYLLHLVETHIFLEKVDNQDISGVNEMILNIQTELKHIVDRLNKLKNKKEKGEEYAS